MGVCLGGVYLNKQINIFALQTGIMRAWCVFIYDKHISPDTSELVT